MGYVNIAKLLECLFLTILARNSLAVEDHVCDECEVSFEYDGIEFDGCTFYNWQSPDVDYNQPMTWCVTNRTAFLEDESTGWEYCSSECSRDSRAHNLNQNSSGIDDRVCDDCKFPFEYDGIEFDGCTFYHWQSPGVDYHQPMTWCVTNKTTFLEDEATGWEYCSSECLRDSRGHNQS